LAARCITRESSDGSICDEIASDTDESEVSDSSTERVDLPEALDEAGDGMEPTYAEVEGKSSVRSTKKSKKKGRKSKGGKVILPL
jgi:hypothetical protein